MTDEDLFYSWLDGELHGDQAERVAARVAADPQLAKLAAQHRALGATLRKAFDPIASAPLPDRLSDALRPGSEVVDLAAARSARAARKPAAGWQQWAAIAATLVVGIVTGTMVQRGNGSPVEEHGGRLFASATLDKALDTQLASAGRASSAVRIGVTFRDQSGALCRSFTDAATSGLACRIGEQWQVRGLFAAPEGGQSDYRMAAGADPALAALIDTTIVGDAFDERQERAAQERDWR